MRVRATGLSRKYNIPIYELRRVANPGEEFELSEAAFNRLNGNGPTHLKFVEAVVEEEKPKKKRKKKNED